jgi:hypothetical protein
LADNKIGPAAMATLKAAGGRDYSSVVRTRSARVSRRRVEGQTTSDRKSRRRRRR